MFDVIVYGFIATTVGVAFNLVLSLVILSKVWRDREW